jgi:hypothetical protein
MFTLASEEMASAIPDEDRPKANVWLERGDGIALYENQDETDPEYGRFVFVSYGSDAARLPMQDAPVQMPDTIAEYEHFRYRLIGTYRGAVL